MKRILFIEDDPMLTESVNDFLIEEGFEVIIARNGKDGIYKAIEVLPDLIICDIAMPKADGFEVLDTISRNPDTAAIPFIFLTAKAEKENLRLGMQKGADDYITKPFDLDELLRAIQLRLKKHENIRKLSENKYSAFLESNIIGIYILKNDHLVYHNLRLSRILGYDYDELRMKRFSSLIDSSNKEKFEQKIQHCLQGLVNQFTIDILLKRKDKSFTAVTISGSCLKSPSKDTLGGYIIPSDQKSEGSGEEDLNKSQLKDMLDLGNTRKDPYVTLTPREIDILKMICKGFHTREISDKLFLSKRTVEWHRSNIMEKTATSNSIQLLKYAIVNDLL